MWPVEAKAVRIEDRSWAPLFTTVVEPNSFTATVEQAKQTESRLRSVDKLRELFASADSRSAAPSVVSRWIGAGHRTRLGTNFVVLEAEGPSKNGYRKAVALYADGRVFVPFGSYAGQNSGIAIETLTSDAFRSKANALFGFLGSDRQARTAPGWLTTSRAEELILPKVADAYVSARQGNPGALELTGSVR